MTFVTGRENVGFFGIMNGEIIDLFSENSNSSESDVQHGVLSLNDNFPVKVELESKSMSHGKDDNIQNIFTSVSVSDCGHFIAAADLEKHLFLWKKEKDRWIPVSRRAAIRKAYKVMFTHKGSEIVMADKGGDVFIFSVIDYSENGKMILGHLNIVLDMAMSKNDRYIITSDRENKIRISHFPNSYNICTYCLGHEEFVCALQLVPASEELLVSSSGDGTLKVWHYGNGKQLFSYDLNDSLSNSSALKLISGGDKGVQDSKTINSGSLSKIVVKILRYCCKLNVIAALFYDSPFIAIFQISNNTLERIQFLSLKSTPIDAHFSGDDTLRAILSSEPPTVVSFHCATTDAVYFTEIVPTEPSTDALTAEINKKLASSKLSLEYQMDFSYMFNQCVSYTYDDDNCNNESNVKRNKLAV